MLRPAVGVRWSSACGSASRTASSRSSPAALELARRVGFAQDGLYALLVALVLVWGDYTRTRLALHDTRSAVWAGLCTWIDDPAAPSGAHAAAALLLLAARGALVLALAAWLATRRSERPRAAVRRDWLAASRCSSLGQLALCWRVIVRGARYHAAVAGQPRRSCAPIARPDPWKQSLGGPGGPRYPIDDGEEFGVSL